MVLGTLFGFIVLLSFLSAVLPYSGLNILFSGVCHQQAARSYSMEGHPFGLCIRCFWLYVGLSVGSFRYGFFSTLCQPSKPLLISSLVFAAIHWTAGWFLPFVDWPFLRMISSLAVGLVVSQFAIPGIAELLLTISPSNKTKKLHHEPKRT